MSTPATELTVFISSPGDVAEERALAAGAFERLQREFRETVRLQALMWEREPLLASQGFQSQIRSAGDCDLFVSILWSRLGTPLPRQFREPEATRAPTGTEYEIDQALAASHRSGRPSVLLYRKRAPPQTNLASSEAEERLAQYRALEAFWASRFRDEDGALSAAHHSFTESFEFARMLYEHARKWLEDRVGSGVTAAPRWRAGSPYRGLKAFEAAHRDVYAGRARAVSDVLRIVREVEHGGDGAGEKARFLLIQGMSGNGKSSLVRAGVLPLLELRPIEGVTHWHTLTIKPSERHEHKQQQGALGALAAQMMSLLPPLQQASEDVGELFAKDPELIPARLEGYLATDAQARGMSARSVRVLLFVDQLEELFTGEQSADEVSRVTRALARMAAHPSFWIVATMRSDMVHKLESVKPLASLALQRYTLLPPRPDEIAQMVREPAAAAGLTWDVRDNIRLDEDLVRDAEANPEGLPLLEYALDNLYERRQGAKLTFAAYDEMGGLKGALINTAESIVAAAGEQGSAAFSRVMRGLVSVDDRGTATRRYPPREEFAQDADAQRMVDQLLDRRLCAGDTRGGVPVVLLAHEALISSWPRAVGWLKRERRLLQARDRVARDAQLWDEQGRRRSLLSTAPEKIQDIRRLREAGLSLHGASEDFANRSIRESKLQRALQISAVVAIASLAIIAGIAAVVGVTQRARAELALFRQYEDRAWQALARGDAPLAMRYALAGDLAAQSFSSSVEKSMTPRWRLLLATALNRYIEPVPAEPGTTVPTTDILLRPLQLNDETAALHASFMTYYATHLAKGRPAELMPSQVYVDHTSDGMKALTRTHIFTVDDKRLIVPPKERYLIDRIETTFHVWSVRARTESLTVVLEGEAQARFTHDGTALVVIAFEGQDYEGRYVVRIIDLESKQQRTLPAIFSGAQEVEVSRDGERVLACCEPGSSPRVLELFGEGRLVPVGDATESIRDVEFSPDGTRVAILSEQGEVSMWDAALGRQLFRYAAHGSGAQLRFSPDGKVLLTSDNSQGRLWVADTGREIARLMGGAWNWSFPLFSSDGAALVAHSPDRDQVWRASRLEEEDRLTDGCVPDANATLSADGTRMVVAGSEPSARICAFPTNTLIATLSGKHRAVVFDGWMSHQGDRVVTVSADRTALVWNVKDGHAAHTLQHPQPVRVAAFSPDGEQVATGDAGGGLIVWNAQTGDRIRDLRGHTGAVLSISYSPDGANLVTTSQEGTVAVWNAVSGDLVRGLAKVTVPVRASHVSPDNRTFATGGDDGLIRIWDLRAGTPPKTLTGHRGPVSSVQFAPSDDLLVSASEDGTVRVWETTFGRELETLDLSGVRRAVFTADGAKLVTHSSDRTIRVWGLMHFNEKFAHLAELACQRVLRFERTTFGSAEIEADRSIGETYLRDHDNKRSVCERFGVAATERPLPEEG